MTNRRVIEYVREGSSPFPRRFSALDAQAAAKAAVALYRLEQGNMSNVRSVGKGVSEYKIDFGPGYRIYFGQEGDDLVILLAGGAKKTQDKDIQIAQMLWTEYKQAKARKR